MFQIVNSPNKINKLLIIDRKSGGKKPSIGYSVAIFLTLLGSFLFLGGKAEAATYYVATDGDDARTTAQAQNPATPWKTIIHAESAVADDDTVNIAAGTYLETNFWTAAKAVHWIGATTPDLTVTIQSTSASYLLVTASNNSKAINFDSLIFDGQGIKTQSIVLNNINSTNKTFNNVKLINPKAGSNFTKTSSGSGSIVWNNPVLEDGGVAAGYAFEWNLINSGTISGGTFNFTGNTQLLNVHGSGVTGGTVELSGMTGSAGVALTSPPFVNVSQSSWTAKIKNNNFTLTSATQPNTITISGQTAPEVSGNTIDTTHSVDAFVNINITSPAGVSAPSPLISNNTIRTTSKISQVILVGTDSTSIGDNKIDGGIVENNHIYGPFYYDTNAAGVSKHCIEYGYNKEGIVRNNFVSGCAFGIVMKGAPQDYINGGGVYNNVVLGTKGDSSIRIKGIDNIPVYNNTFYTDPLWSGNSFGMLYITQSDAPVVPSTGTDVKNNAFLGLDTKNLINVDTLSAAAGFTSDYNLHWNNTGSGLDYVVGGDTYTGFAGFAVAGRDTHSVSGNPLFTDASANDFSLQYASPAIDSGSVIGGRTADILNNHIYGTPDIGAYEYQPPFIIGTDKIDPTGNIRIYKDGRYRYTSVISGSGTADLKAAPVDDVFPAGDYSEWLNISNITWGSSKQWTASSSVAGTTVFTVKDLTPSGYYDIKLDGNTSPSITGSTCSGGLCRADGTGKIIFTYSGGYSSHTFSVTPDTTPPVISLVSSSPLSTVTTISWHTDEASSSKVEYGLTSAYGTSTTETDTVTRVTDHSVPLSGLLNCSIYHYRTKSKDAAQNEVIGSEGTFVTSGCSGGSSSFLHSAPVSSVTKTEQKDSKLTISGTSSNVISSVRKVEVSLDDGNTWTQASSYTSNSSLGLDWVYEKTVSPGTYLIRSKATDYLGIVESPKQATTVVVAGQVSVPAQVITPIITPQLSVQERISELQTLLVSLQAQLAKLQASTPLFTHDLQRGDIGDDVKQLQTILSKDPSIYPEGIVNGRFGPATEAAVKRFQKKYGIRQTGYVGPLTRGELGE